MKKESMNFQNDLNNNSENSTAVEAFPVPTAADIMLDAVYTVTPETAVFKAIASMLSRKLTSIPVVDADHQLLGILSEKDVLCLVQDPDADKKTVADFMCNEVVTVTPETPIEDICRCFNDNNFRRVAVVQGNELVSMISRNQVIRSLAYKFGLDITSAIASYQPAPFSAKEVMTAGLFTLSPDDSLAHVVDLLISRNVTALPIINNSMNLLGIVSEKDVITLLCSDNCTVAAASDIMTANVRTFNPDDSLLDICDCLRNNHFRRVIITKDNKIVGILSRTDIIKFILTNRTAFIRHASSGN